MNETESIKDFADKLMKIVSQIKVLREKLEDKRVVEKDLVSLPRRFAHKICSLEDNKNITTLSVTELVNSLHIAELRRNLRIEDAPESALVSQFKGKARISERRQAAVGKIILLLNIMKLFVIVVGNRDTS